MLRRQRIAQAVQIRLPVPFIEQATMMANRNAAIRAMRPESAHPQFDAITAPLTESLIV